MSDDHVDAGVQSEDPDERTDIPKIRCPTCMAPNAESAHMCHKCLAPLTTFAATDPLMSISARADTFIKASNAPRSPIVLAGVWIIFGPVAFICFVAGIAAMRGLLSGNPAALLALVPVVLGLFISIGLLIKTTTNYITKTTAQSESFPLVEDTTNKEAEADDGEWKNFEEPK